MTTLTFQMKPAAMPVLFMLDDLRPWPIRIGQTRKSRSPIRPSGKRCKPLRSGGNAATQRTS
jgi:hypothetical protein